MAARNICGCWYSTRTEHYSLQRHYLPQLELSSHTTINPLSFTTALTQTFINPTAEPIKEARYTFPLYDGVAVTAFSCTIGDRVIIGRVEQKEKARKTFDDAVAKGESAGLLESLPVGIFASTLGNIPANATMIVNVTYGGELKHDAQIDGLRFCIPTSIAPRYGAYPGELLMPDSALLIRGMRITVDVDMAGSAIRKIQSPSKDHAISVSLGNLSTESGRSTPQMFKASVTLAHETVELSTDFVLQILVDDITSPRAVLERHPTLPNHQALMTTFVPKFNLKSITPEIVFIADQSGSMMGQTNSSLIAAMTTFLKSLPLGVRFNICPFGSHHEFLWDKSRPYTSESVSTAISYVQAFRASFGGTEMFPAVEATFKQRLGDIPLEIILLTDGQIYQEQAIFDLVHDQLHKEKVDARVFTLGIGNDVSTTLVEGVARAGRGFSQFVNEGEVLDQKVVRMLKAALYPHIHDFRLELNYADDLDDFEMVETEKSSVTPAEANSPNDAIAISMFDETTHPDAPIPTIDCYAHLPELSIPDTLQAPYTRSPLFIFNRTTSYLLMAIKSNKLPNSVTLHAKSSQGPLKLEISIESAAEGNTIHHLAVRKLVQELEENRGWVMDSMLDGKKVSEHSRSDEIAEREAVRLGLKYQVANKWCSFVAVEGDQPLTGPNQPNEVVPESGKMSVGGFGRSARIGGGSRGGWAKKKQPMTGGIALQDAGEVEESYEDMGFAAPPPHFAVKNCKALPSTQHCLKVLSANSSAASAPASGLIFGRQPVASPSAHPTTLQSFSNALASSPNLPVHDRIHSSRAPDHSSSGLFGHSSSGLFGHSSSGLFGHSSTGPFGQALLQPQYRAAVSLNRSMPISSNNNYFNHSTQPTDIDRVRQLITMQNFAGYWEWNSTGLESFEVDISSLLATMSTHGCKEDNATMTALVLHLLKTKMSAYKGVWEMVAEKGEAWLDNEATEEQKMQLEKLVNDVA